MGTNNGKTLAILAAIIAVVGLGIGFAAFTRTLTINGNVTVNPNGSLGIAWSTTATDHTCSCTASTESSRPTGTAAPTCNKGTASDTVITNPTANLTYPGDSCTYTYKAKNSAQYIAYLKSITTSGKTCSAASGLGADACGNVHFTWTCVGGTVSDTSTSSGTISASNSVAKSGTANCTLVINWAVTDPIVLPDSAVTVTIAHITNNFSTAN